MAERVDVLIAGSGFGGSITAFRLAELYRAAGADPRAIVAARARPPLQAHRLQAVDGRRPPLERLQPDPGPGRADRRRQRASAAARTSTSPRRCARPRETFERRDRRPGDGPERRMWPSADLARSARPVLRARRGRPARQPADVEPGVEVRRPVGGDAAPRPATPATACRSPSAPSAASNAKWCHTGCIFGAKNSLITNYLPSAERLGVQVRPGVEVQSVRQSQARPVPLRGHRRPAPDGRGRWRSSARSWSSPTGAMGNAPILMRSRNDLPSLSDQVGKHLGVNGDHVAAIEYDPKKVRERARPARLRRLPQGQADHDDDLRLLGRAPRPPLRRHALQPPGDLPVVADELPLRRRPRPGGRPVVVGPAEEAGDRELGQPHRAAGDGRGHPRRRVLRRAARSGGAVRPNAGPVADRARSPTRSPSSRSACARRPTRR